MLPSAAELVARFLRANGYTETLASFIEEAGLSQDAGAAAGSEVTIEQILQEKKTFDLSLSFERVGVDDPGHRWQEPAPSKPTILSTLPARSNILSVHLLSLVLSTTVDEPKPYIAVTTADRRLNLIDPTAPSFPLIRSYANFQDSPILDLLVINSKYLLTASMSGRLVLYNTATDQIIEERKDHSKYLVKLASWSDGLSTTIVASAGWDAKVVLYRVNNTNSDNAQLGEPVTTIALPSIPESILFIQSPDTSQPILLLTRRDSTFLYYYTVPTTTAAVDTSSIALLGKQNLAPHSNAWVAFTPSDVQLCPADPSIAAIATSSTPHMRVIVVRLLVPPYSNSTTNTNARDRELVSGVVTDPILGSRSTLTQASQTQANLVIQDREEAAIMINITTMAPQTAYSTPKLVWRPDGSGIFVSSDDGVVRGFEASTGKPIASLEAHEVGSKLRCLWAGRLHGGSDDSNSDEGEEHLISGGFDQRLVIWSAL